MERTLSGLAEFYSKKYGPDELSVDRLRNVYDRYVREHQQSLLDAAAATVAVNGLFLSDRVNTDEITPQMQEAFELAFPNMRIDQLESYDPSVLTGIISNWKGKLFEVELRDRLNSGDWVGDIHLGPGQRVELASDLSQPGWDLQILNADGTVDEVLQAKATDSISYIHQALEKYPDIEIVATEEAATQWTEQIINSEINNEDLEEEIIAPMEELLDSGLEGVAEMISPILPIIVIAVSEGRRVMIGQHTFQVAMNNSIERGVKSGAAIGVGGLLSLLGAGIITLPTTFLTQVAIERAMIERSLRRKVESDVAVLKALVAG